MKNYWKQNKKLEIVSEQYLHGFLCVPGQSSVFISGRLKGVEFAALSTSIYWMPHGFCVYYLHKSQGLVVFSPFSKGETDLSTNLTKVTQPLSGRDRILKTKILVSIILQVIRGWRIFTFIEKMFFKHFWVYDKDEALGTIQLSYVKSQNAWINWIWTLSLPPHQILEWRK